MQGTKPVCASVSFLFPLVFGPGLFRGFLGGLFWLGFGFVCDFWFLKDKKAVVCTPTGG